MNKEAKILIGITVATIVALVGGSFFFSKKDAAPAAVSDSKVYDQALLVNENPHVKGSTDPKVTIVEFGDFQCPACAASFPVTQQLEKEYGDKIKFVFRHFPLAQHENAYDAARASEAAAAQGKFWEMHDKLYETRDTWGEKKDAVTQFEGFAKDLGLNVEQFKKAFSDKPYDAIIQKGLTDGTTLGVNATPTFFVNGKKMSGVFTLNEWKNLLSEYLK